MVLTPWAPDVRAIGRDAERFSGWVWLSGTSDGTNDLNQIVAGMVCECLDMYQGQIFFGTAQFDSVSKEFQ